MSKIWTKLNVKILKIRLELKNKKKNIFSEIIYEDFYNLEDLTKIKNFFNSTMSFLEQFDPIEKNLKVKLNINMSNKKNVFSYNQYNKTLNVFINNNYRNVKETLNHEFLHVLDYYNGKNNEPFSEIYNNIEDKINKKPKIAKLQNYILKGENVKKIQVY
jgi:predicted RND superfamily exporter protein